MLIFSVSRRMNNSGALVCKGKKKQTKKTLLSKKSIVAVCSWKMKRLLKKYNVMNETEIRHYGLNEKRNVEDWKTRH